MFIRVHTLSHLGFSVSAGIGKDDDVNKCFLKLKEQVTPASTSPAHPPVLLKGMSSVFLSSLLEWFIARQQPFNDKKQSLPFRMCGLLGPNITGTSIGICCLREPGTNEYQHQSRYRASIYYSRNQAQSALEERLVGSQYLSKYLAYIDEWKIPERSDLPSENIEGEIAKLMTSCSLIYYVRRIMQKRPSI
jgi:hypothetical protein